MICRARRAPFFRAARFGFVGLANNHSLDYFEEGLVETMEVLWREGVAFAGVGLAAEAAAPAVVERAGMRLGFLAYSDHYEHWRATPQARTPDLLTLVVSLSPIRSRCARMA